MPWSSLASWALTSTLRAVSRKVRRRSKKRTCAGNIDMDIYYTRLLVLSKPDSSTGHTIHSSVHRNQEWCMSFGLRVSSIPRGSMWDRDTVLASPQCLSWAVALPLPPDKKWVQNQNRLYFFFFTKSQVLFKWMFWLKPRFEREQIEEQKEMDLSGVIVQQNVAEGLECLHDYFHIWVFRRIVWWLCFSPRHIWPFLCTFFGELKNIEKQLLLNLYGYFLVDIKILNMNIEFEYQAAHKVNPIQWHFPL